jgi:glycosyltransferase involved in cell wall biosynthesis
MSLHHICFISQEYPPETGWGGVGSYTYEMAHALVQAGYRVTVIARATKHEQVTNDAGVEVHRVLPAPDWGRYPGLWRINRVWPGFAWSAMVRLRQIHSRFPIDVVESSECRADSFFIPWIQNRPRIVTRLHTAWIFIDRMNAIAPDQKKRLIYWLEGQTIRKADIITAPSQAVVDLTRTWVPISQSQVFVVPNPVDTLLFSPGDERRGDEILFVGRLERNKGVGDICQALPNLLQRHSKVDFRFVGSDSVDEKGRSWRERILNNLHPKDRKRVHFEHVPRARLVERYRQAGVCVLPSLWENFPYTVLEAMSCATPVVATRTGGIPELVDNGVTGVLVPSANPSQLAETLLNVFEDRELRNRLGQNARRQVVDRCSTKSIVPKMLEVYEAALMR